ncbi:MAG: CCA tRNA nucleotidyltransferase [Candidatus Bathyarchaeota archaeon]|nr:MAG: CCA tRNA nucleotidyltransferase [Candidatus Bathyarchaeota archaeon]
MKNSLEKLLNSVLKRVSPTAEDSRRITKVADEFHDKVERALRKAGLPGELRIEGSLAKDTWLRDSADIDIFIRIPPEVPWKAFGTDYLKAAKKATAGLQQVERFSEHPYLEAVLNGTRINIVPCYGVERGAWKSATDRTPFHTDYVKPKLDETLRGQVRLLKQFMKGIGVYGSEMKVGGFSGYLCELLILHYRTFLQTIRAAGNWKPPTLIALEAPHLAVEEYEGSLVIVDPVDEKRNAASAVTPQRLSEFIGATRGFLHNPHPEFFYPSPIVALSPDALLKTFRQRRTTFVFIEFGKINAVSDVVWGQLYKSQRALKRLVEAHDFHVVSDGVWADDTYRGVFLLELEESQKPLMQRHLGPPLVMKEESENFLAKHATSPATLYGPRIEGDRWVAGIPRKYSTIADLLRGELKHGGREIGVAELVAEAFTDLFRILIDDEIGSFYREKTAFAKFLTTHLHGRPRWLQ